MVTRLTGLASGFDTETTVTALMKAARIPLDKLTQKKQLLEWQRDDYRTLNAKILELRTAASDMKIPSKYQAKSASSSDNTVVSVIGSSVANTGVYNIKVTQLATTASVNSGDLTGVGSDTKTLGSLAGWASDITKLDITGDKGTSSIELKSTDTIAQFVANVNGKSSVTGVKASYDSTLDRLFFVSSTTGSASKVELVQDGTNSDLFNTGGATLTATPGVNAKVSFNGLPEVEYSSNNFTISGMSFSAKKAQASTDTAINITVSQDTDTIYNSIKTFVDKYNALIEAVNAKTEEKRYRDFQPLSTDQKDAMKEDDIKSWNVKAMSGMLSNDQMLTSGLSSFRTALSSTVGGISTGYKSLSEIGISSSVMVGSTVSGSYLDKGKLYIDDTRLKAAIADNPDQVTKLFLANDNDKDSSAGDGIAVRMYDQANQLFTKISNKAGLTTSVQSSYLIGKSLKDIDKQVDTLSLRLDSLETRYYKQYTSMEKYINNMNAASANLTKQFG